MSETLDSSYRLDYDGPTTLLAAASACKQAALQQLRLAEAGDNVQQRLATAQIHMLGALAILIENDIAQTEGSGRNADLMNGNGRFSVSRYSVTVRLFHNTNPAATTEGYNPDSDRAVEVYAYHQHDVANTTSDQDIVATVIEMFGAADQLGRVPRDHRIINYVDRGNRPLTIGDLVAIDRRCYALTDTGSVPVAFPVNPVTGGRLPSGSTPL